MKPARERELLRQVLSLMQPETGLPYAFRDSATPREIKVLEVVDARPGVCLVVVSPDVFKWLTERPPRNED